MTAQGRMRFGDDRRQGDWHDWRVARGHGDHRGALRRECRLRGVAQPRLANGRSRSVVLDFAGTLRRIDRIQSALLVLTLASTIGFDATVSGVPHRWRSVPPAVSSLFSSDRWHSWCPFSAAWSTLGQISTLPISRDCEPPGYAATWLEQRLCLRHSFCGLSQL